MEKKERKKKPWVMESAVYSALRRAYKTSPAVNAAWDRNKEEFFVLSKHGKQMRRVRFKCEKCDARLVKGKGRKTNLQVDHVHPVVDPVDGNLMPDGTRNWNKQVARLMVGENQLQLLCKPCHSVKSSGENKVRREVKKALKADKQ